VINYILKNVQKNLNTFNQKEIVDMSGLVQGVYLYKVVQNNLLISAGKIVKE
jgi:hypothetical protein